MLDPQAIQQAIAACQPPWLPQPGTLAGVTVVIDPAGGGASEPEQRQRDDAALLTGLYLYHLVRHAGGVPIMTRVDDQPACHALRPAARHPAPTTAAQAAALIAIESGAPEEAVFAIGDDAGSRALALALAEAAGVRVSPRPVDSAHSSARACAAAAGARLACRASSASGADCFALCRDDARRIFAGIAAFARGAARTGDQPCAAAPAAAAPEAPRAVPYLPDLTWEQEIALAARRIWPAGRLPIEKAAWFCEMYCRTALSDRTLVYLRPEVAVDAGTVTLGGATNIAVLRETLADALRAVGVENVRNGLRLLPEDGRLDGARFGVCVAPQALTFEQPSAAAGVQSQLLYGEALLLLDRERGWFLVHGGDGYWGWVREECVRVLSAEQSRAYRACAPALVLRDLEAGGRRIVRGARLPVAARDAQRVLLLCPDDSTIAVAPDVVRIVDAAPAQRVARALELLGRPYVYGGVCPLGLDCSGLVRMVLAEEGQAAPRNAAQQFAGGRLAGTRWWRDGIRAGDLLYFISSSGRIFHVGIAISPTHFVHAAPPEVQINSLIPGDRLYSAYRERAFFAARRVP